jgi:hypothetical protein
LSFCDATYEAYQNALREGRNEWLRESAHPKMPAKDCRARVGRPSP